MIVNLGMLATYDQYKQMVGKYYDVNSYPVMISGSIIAGVVSAFVSLPTDNIKTKLMRMNRDKDGNYPYSGLMDCLRKSIRREGVRGLWVGCFVYITRLTPHTIIVYILVLFIGSYSNGYA